MRLFIAFALLLVFTYPAHAQKFEYGKYEDVKDVKKVEWVAAAEAGVLFTTGNSETTSGTAGVKASRKSGDNKFSVEGSAAYAKSDLRVIQDLNGNGMIDNASEITSVPSITAETLYGKLRYDRYFTELNSLFLAFVASRDLPGGKEAVLGGQIGYSRSLYKSKTAQTTGEFGYDYAHEDPVAPGPALSIHSLRAFVGHHATMTEGADLDASAELLSNLNRETLPTHKDGGTFEDTRLNIKLAISAKIGVNLAFQAALEAHYDHRPPILGIKNLAMDFTPEASKLDTLMKASFIYTFVGAKK
jgi:hypothetical protein